MKNHLKTIFKESITAVITFQVIILRNVPGVGGKCNFISRNLGHKELIKVRASITVSFFPGSFAENQLRYYKSLMGVVCHLFIFLDLKANRRGCGEGERG